MRSFCFGALVSVFAIAACAKTNSVSIEGLSREHERFLELAFSPADLGLGRQLERSSLRIRPEYRISIRGNQANRYSDEVEQSLEFFRNYFNIRRVAENDPSANVILFIEGATSGGPLDAKVKQWNKMDEAIFDRSGWTFKRNRLGNVVGPREDFVPTRTEDLALVRYNTEWCITRYIFDDAEQHGKNGGGWVTRAPEDGRDLAFPDYAISYVFTGVTSSFEGEISPEGRIILEDQEKIVPYCIFEEMAHALNFWADVYSPIGEVPFNEGEYVNWDAEAETLRNYVAREYEAQLPDIKSIFDLYRQYELTNGLTRPEVIKRFLNSKD